MLPARTVAAGVLALGVFTTPAAAAPITYTFSFAEPIRTLDLGPIGPGDYRIVAAGAAGGGFHGGRGARAEGIFTLNGTETLTIIVGRRGGLNTFAGGGGGGSFVFIRGTAPDGSDSVPLVVGGGGGGQGLVQKFGDFWMGRDASLTPNGTAGKGDPEPGVPGVGGGAGGSAGFGGTTGGRLGGPPSAPELDVGGGGGGGFYGSGLVNPLFSPADAATALNRVGQAAIGTAQGGEPDGTAISSGGFGGGGSSTGFDGGGGGGFSGGGGGGGAGGFETPSPGGGGGGSFVNSFFGGYIPNSQVLSLVDDKGNAIGSAFVMIEYLGRGGGRVAVPAPGGLAVLAVALLGLAAVRRRV